MMDANLKKLGFSLSNPGLLEEVEAEVKAEFPQWNDTKVKTERNKRLKEKTLFNDDNKKPKKVKKPKADKTKKDK